MLNHFTYQNSKTDCEAESKGTTRSHTPDNGYQPAPVSPSDTRHEPSKGEGMRLNALKLGMFKSFGLDGTGKAVSAADDAKVPKPNIWNRFKFQFGRIMNPIKNITAGIAKFASGAAS